MLQPLITEAQTRLHSITVKGKVSDLNNRSVSMARIDISKGNQVIKYVIANSAGNYDFILEKGAVYTLTYSKHGYVSKKIEVSTDAVGEDELKYGLFPVVIDVAIFEDFKGLDKSPLMKPVVKFAYVDEEGDFLYDEEYALKMAKEVDKVVAAQKKLKKQAYDNSIRQADVLFEDEWLEESLLEYQNALSLFPAEKYPKQQIDKIRQALQKKADIEKTYSSHIKKGDQNFNKQNYQISKSYYQKSLIYKPQEVYPQSRIDEIEKILAGNSELYNKNEKDVSLDADPTEKLISGIDENSSGNHVNNEQKGEQVTVSADEKNYSENFSKNQGISKISSHAVATEDKKGNEETSEYLNNLLDRYAGSGDSVNVARVHIAMGIEAFNKHQNDQAVENFRLAYEMFGKAGMKEDQATVAESLGDIYFSMYRYSASADWYAKASGLYSGNRESGKANTVLLKSADASYQSGDFDIALSKYIKVVNQSEKTADLSSLYNSIGVIYFETENYEQALKYYDLSVKSAENAGNEKELAMSLNNIGNVKYEGNDYNSALSYYGQSINKKTSIDYKAGIAVSLHNIANVYRKTGDYNKALEYYAQSEKFALASGNTDVIYENYGALADLYSKMKDCSNAVRYYKLYAETRHLITRKQGKDQINESSPYYANMLDTGDELELLRDEIRKQRLLAFYESARKQKEIEYLNLLNQLSNQKIKSSESQIKTQRLMIALIAAGLLLVLLFLILLFRQFRQKKKANLLLAEQNEEINAQKQEIESQRDLLFEQKEKIELIHLELTDSIRYAQRIQDAVLSSVKALTDTFPKTFIIYKPLEMVSGDFYWSVRSGNSLVFCVADCTGHGVPGAFMSMLGISFLNEIVLTEKITQPDQILNYLRDSIIRALGQKETADRYGLTRIRDGMDISLCAINLETLELQFAGANNPLYIIKPANSQWPMANSQLIELKGDKMPIGYYERMEPFTCKNYQLVPGDTLYLFSDGYVDQFGGKQGKKFKNQSLKSLLLSLNNLPLNEQRAVIEKTHQEWKGEMNQIDDISMLGVKIFKQPG
jgi:serine phosphatase RsbU (regulator of sigma subunit)/tetratricopeptide (TPR) repeat protein